MAEKRRFLDVHLVDSNMGYSAVPFTVVADWIQQGRLLEDDRVRPAGAKDKDFLRLGDVPDFAPYFPKVEPTRPQDRAEALEPVQGEIIWKRRSDEEEDDPDMIPLIDVSLVLLIFFIMTTAGAAALTTNIDTPTATFLLTASLPDALWVGIDCDESRQPTVYSIGVGEKAADEEYRVPKNHWQPGDREMKVPPQFANQLNERLKRETQGRNAKVDVMIKTDKRLMDGYYVNLQVELQKNKNIILKRYDGVTEKKQP